jgi:hypothetical protein
MEEIKGFVMQVFIKFNGSSIYLFVKHFKPEQLLNAGRKLNEQIPRTLEGLP